MRVRMSIKVLGTRNGVEWPEIGGEMDLPDDEAAGYIRNGYCVALSVEERAVAPEPLEERAVAPAPGRRTPGRPRKS